MARNWMTIFKISVVWAVLALLYGCAGTTAVPERIVYVETVVDKSVVIPQELLQVHSASAPPSKQEFLPYTPVTTEQVISVLKIQRDLLFKYSQDLLVDIRTNQDKLLLIRGLVDKHKEASSE